MCHVKIGIKFDSCVVINHKNEKNVSRLITYDVTGFMENSSYDIDKLLVNGVYILITSKSCSR